MTAQRPYKTVSQDSRRALKMRHANGRLDATVTRERMLRPFGATPRTSQDWR